MGFIDVVKSNKDWRNSLHKDNQVFYRTTTYKTKKGPEPRVIVRIGKNIMESLGWKIGDNLSLMQDEDDKKILRLKLNKRNGYVIKPAVIPQGESHSDQIGKLMRGSWEARIFEQRPLPKTDKTTVKIREFDVVNGMLDIKLPRDFDFDEL